MHKATLLIPLIAVSLLAVSTLTRAHNDNFSNASLSTLTNIANKLHKGKSSGASYITTKGIEGTFSDKNKSINLQYNYVVNTNSAFQDDANNLMQNMEKVDSSGYSWFERQAISFCDEYSYIIHQYTNVKGLSFTQHFSYSGTNDAGFTKVQNCSL
jgi:hypothetical protein